MTHTAESDARRRRVRDELELLGRMHLDAIGNGDWEAAAKLAEAIETYVIPPEVDAS